MKRLALLLAGALALASCAPPAARNTGVYLLIDTSGSYNRQMTKAEQITLYALTRLQSADSIAVARIDTGSFTEKDIIAKATFDPRPSQANAQKRAFRDQFDAFARSTRGSAYTDITGGLIQGALFLNETGAGRKTILIFSDMQEELDKQVQRDFPIDLKNIRVVAVNVVKLKTDNVDPRRYLGRLDDWQKRVKSAGAADWLVINDIEHLDRLLKS